MNGPEHYLSKMERNANAILSIPESQRTDFLNHLMWAKELAKKLDNLDYDQRNAAIKSIIQKMDEDYSKMFPEEDLQENKSMGR